MIWARRHFLYQNILNGLIFYIYWGYCMWAVAQGDFWAPPIAMLLVALVHFAGTPRPKQEIRLILVAMVIGTCIDTIFQLVGAVKFNTSYPEDWDWIAPLWISCLHANFAMTLYHSLRWLHPRPWLASVLGACGAMFTYFGGQQLGAAVLPWGLWESLALIGAVWAVYLPGLYLSKL